VKQTLLDYLAELRGSPLKTSVIGLLLVCGLLLWGRLLLKEVPRTASADDPLTAVSALAEGTLRQASEDRTLKLVPPPPLQRDLFALDPSRYRRTAAQEDEASEAKLRPLGAEDTRQAAVVSAARQLRLTSFIEGQDPVVMINDRPLRRGDTVEGFTVLGFQDRSVVLVKQGIKVRLSL
jgi:hypothetical protein